MNRIKKIASEIKVGIWEFSDKQRCLAYKPNQPNAKKAKDNVKIK